MISQLKVVVTGASTGIGAATAIDLAKSSSLVVVHYHSSEQAAQEVAREVEKNGAKAVTVKADLSTEAGCRSFMKAVEKESDYIDVLVNNAGGLVERRPIRDITWDIIEKVFTLNAFSLIQLSGLAVPLLEKAAAPCIVNVSSIVVRHGAAGATLYGSAKGAVDVFTRGMAKELSPKIRVNAVAPGVIETPFHDKVSTPEMLKKWSENCPLHKNGSSEEIAHTIRYLIENGFVHGETVDVNGGMFMR